MMNNSIINYGLISLGISLLYGLLPLTNAAKPIISKAQQSLTQLKTKAHLSSSPSTHETVSYNKDILHESSKSINIDEAEESEKAYRLLNEWKQDSSNYLPWNSLGRAQQMPIFEPYSPLTSMSQTLKLFHFFGYPQPFFIPYHLGMSPELLYANFVGNNPTAEDNISRARRPINSSQNFQRNSPIYYVRLPPTPYMFLPNFNYPSATSSHNPYMPYSSISNTLPISSVFNLPINFLSNGKPNGIYRIDGSSNELQHERFPFISPELNHITNSFPPITSTLTPHSLPPASFSNISPQHKSHHPIGVKPSTELSLPEITETKLTSSKRPYLFNGRPEDIYILPNNFNSIYSESNFY